MKLITRKTLLPILIALPLVMTAGPLTAQVYKTVDEDGNVTYTDRPPQDGSKPIKLRPISVIEAPAYEQAPSAAQKAAAKEGEEKPLRYLRKHYEDFAIVSPAQEEAVWYSENVVTVAWSVPSALEPGMQVTVSVDGAQQPATSERVIPIIGLERGEHTATAVLRDARSRLVANAEPVTFFIRQPNLYTRPGPRPRGSG